MPIPQPDDRADAPPASELSERDRAILEFERSVWRFAGVKESAVRERFDLSMTRYYQVVNALLSNPAAMEFDPFTVRRLLRIRASRARSRSAKRLP